MKKGFTTLFQGDPNGQLAQLVGKAGMVVPFTGNEAFVDYNLVVLDRDLGKTDNYASLFREVLDAGSTLAVINVTENDTRLLMEITGRQPSEPPLIVLVTKLQDAKGNFHYRMDSLQKPGPAYLNALKEANVNYDTIVYTGLKKHLTGLQSTPVINDLIPEYSISPYGFVNVPKRVITVHPDVKNLDQQSLGVESALYCYWENASTYPTKDYWVIAVTKLTGATPGGAVQYTKQDNDCCTIIYDEWDQIFSYKCQLTPLDANENPFPKGINVYNSSPAKQKAASSLTDTTGNDVYQFHMRVLANGVWQDTIFAPYYKNVMDGPNVKWFDVDSGDDNGSNKAGVSFAIPKDPYYGGGGKKIYVPNTATVDFEMMSFFKFDNSLASGGKLPVKFKFDLNFNAGQYKLESIQTVGVDKPVVTTSSHNYPSCLSFVSDLIDLAGITNK